MSLLDEAKRIASTWEGELAEGLSLSVSFSKLQWDNFKKLIAEEEGRLLGAKESAPKVATPAPVPAPTPVVAPSIVVDGGDPNAKSN